MRKISLDTVESGSVGYPDDEDGDGGWIFVQKESRTEAWLAMWIIRFV